MFFGIFNLIQQILPALQKAGIPRLVGQLAAGLHGPHDRDHHVVDVLGGQRAVLGVVGRQAFAAG
jgi:hypothetical protein